MAPNICGSSVQTLLRITRLVRRILTWLLYFWNVCVPLYNYMIHNTYLQLILTRHEYLNIHNAEWLNGSKLWTGKDVWNNDHGLIKVAIPSLAWNDKGKPRWISYRVILAVTHIRTEALLEISQKRYCLCPPCQGGRTEQQPESFIITRHNYKVMKMLTASFILRLEEKLWWFVFQFTTAEEMLSQRTRTTVIKFQRIRVAYKNNVQSCE